LSHNSLTHKKLTTRICLQLFSTVMISIIIAIIG